MKFTPIQIANWRRYEKVRLRGRWNMFFPQARAATGLTPEEHSFCIENYGELKEEAEKEIA